MKSLPNWLQQADDGKRTRAQLMDKRNKSIYKNAHTLWLFLQISPRDIITNNESDFNAGAYEDVKKHIALALVAPPIVKTFLDNRTVILSANTRVHAEVAADLRAHYGTLTAYNSIQMYGVIPFHHAHIKTWDVDDGEITWFTPQSAQFGLGWTALLCVIPRHWTFFDVMMAMGIV
jgi:hypothetical protein